MEHAWKGVGVFILFFFFCTEKERKGREKKTSEDHYESIVYRHNQIGRNYQNAFISMLMLFVHLTLFVAVDAAVADTG